jgi:hypothetical protein
MNLTKTFNDSDGDKLFYLISKSDGDYLPSWLNYEEVTFILSGVTNVNSTNTEVMIIADDRRGGNCFQTFNITIIDPPSALTSYLALIIVSSLIGTFLFGVVMVMCFKNGKCCKCKKKKTTTD